MNRVIILFLFYFVFSVIGLNYDDIQSLYREGREHFENAQFSEAEEVWKKLIQLAPQLEVLWTNLGVTLENQGKYEDAAKIYKLALTKQRVGEEENLFINLCTLRTKQFMDATLFDHGEDVRTSMANEAKLYCQSARERHPSSAKAFQTSGVLYTEIFEYDRAIEYLKRSLEIDPRDPKTNLFLSTAYSRAGYLKEAIEQSKKTLEVSPTADNYHSDGIIKNVCTNEDPESFISHRKAIEIHSNGIKHSECPRGYTPQIGWENIPKDNEWDIKVDTIVKGSRKTYGFEVPRLPDPNKVTGNNSTNMVNNLWREHDVVLVKMKNVYLEGWTGILYTPDCTVFTGGHKEVSKIVQEFVGGVGKTETKIIEEPVASILQQNPANYYHYLVETFSRFLFLYNNLLKKPEFSKMKVLVPKMASTFVTETIVEMLGFPASRLIWYDRNQGHVRYFLKEVYIADWHWTKENNIQPNDLSALYFPPKQALLETRRLFGNSKSSENTQLNVIYLSREDATVRKISPDDERKLIMTIMDVVGPGNFQWYIAAGQSIRSQIDTFINASIIIGPHGAGLTNMIWSSPGTTIVQFPMNPNNDNCFGYLAASLNMDYWLIPQINSYYYGVYPEIKDNSVEALKVALEQILLEKGFEVGGNKIN